MCYITNEQLDEVRKAFIIDCDATIPQKELMPTVEKYIQDLLNKAYFAGQKDWRSHALKNMRTWLDYQPMPEEN